MGRAPNSFTAMTRLLANSSQPVYAVDEQRTILFCNAACERWIGAPASELVGRRCDYHSEPLGDAADERAASLCPPPAAFLGRPVEAVLTPPTLDGRSSRRRVRFEPIRKNETDDFCVLAFVETESQPAAAAPGASSISSSGAAIDFGALDAVSGAALAGDAPTSEPPSIDSSPEQLHAELQQLRAAYGRRFRVDRLVGHSLAATRIREQVRCAIDARGRTLIVGPPGSGRQHLARTIHQGRGGAADWPLLPIDCQLLDAELLRSTVTAFVQHHRSASSAGPATLLLLDVDRLSLEGQNELVRFCSPAKSETLTLSVARTPLLTLAARGEFREDLAYGLSTLTIELPTLASRSEDVVMLAQMFLEETNREGGRQLGGFTPDALRLLSVYPWPNNLEELADAVRQASERASGALVSAADLPPAVRLAGDAALHPRRPDPPIVLDELLAEMEKELIARALRQAKGNKAKAAKLLGVQRARLLRRITQLNL